MKRGKTDTSAVTPVDGSIEQALREAIHVLDEAMEHNAVFLWTGGKEANVIADLLLYTIGERDEVSPVPFVTIDTGNHYNDMYEFRNQYVTPGGIGPQTGLANHDTKIYEDFVLQVLQNDDDPRGYHGRWDSTVSLPEEDLVDGIPRSPEEWNVASSCGTAKTVPIRQLIEQDSTHIITGRRGNDPLVAETDSDFSTITEKKQPLSHTRYNPLANWSEAFVYAYIKRESVPLCDLYTQKHFTHTDSVCCTDEDDATAGEYGEGGRDPQKVQQREELEQMGYV